MAKSSARLTQLDGLRGPLCIGVIAINMDLYNAGANTPVGLFLVLSGLTSFLAYNAKDWDDEARAQFFVQRLVRLLPMLLVSTSFQLLTSALWLFRRGVSKPSSECKSLSDTTCTTGGTFTFCVALMALILILTGGGAICRATACGCFGCCRIDHWPRPTCALFPLVLGTYLTGTGWYVGLLIVLNGHFLPKLLAEHGETWRATPPSWLVLAFWASLEGLQFALPYLAFVVARAFHPLSQAQDIWYMWTLSIYLGAPPLYRLVTFVFGLQLGRWALFEVRKERQAEHPLIPEAKTLLTVLFTSYIVVSLHGVLEHETAMHSPSTGSTPPQWLAIHLIHPFNVLALICSLVASPHSLVARFLSSPPLTILGELSYAMYLLQVGVITAYTFAFDKSWGGEIELLQASPSAEALNVMDWVAVVLICTGLAYPVTHWIEPRVATWLRARLLSIDGALV